jgi:hypothetical protein
MSTSTREHAMNNIRTYIDDKLDDLADAEPDERPDFAILKMRKLLPCVEVTYRTLMSYGVYTVIEQEYRGFEYVENRARWKIDVDEALDAHADAGDDN